MDFADSGLPQDPRIERCFNRIKELQSQFRCDPHEALENISATARVMAEGYPPENPPVALICAIFLANLKPGSYERDNVRHDYGYDVFKAMKNLEAFPALFADPGFISALLPDPATHADVRLLHLAHSLAGIRDIAEALADHPASAHDPDILGYYEGFVMIGYACRGANPLMDYLLDEEVRKFHDLRSGKDRMIQTQQSSGPKPVLH